MKEIMHMKAQKKIGKKREFSTEYSGVSVYPFSELANGEILSLTPYTKERFPKNHKVINLNYAIIRLSAAQE